MTSERRNELLEGVLQALCGDKAFERALHCARMEVGRVLNDEEEDHVGSLVNDVEEFLFGKASVE